MPTLRSLFRVQDQTERSDSCTVFRCCWHKPRIRYIGLGQYLRHRASQYILLVTISYLSLSGPSTHGSPQLWCLQSIDAICNLPHQCTQAHPLFFSISINENTGNFWIFLIRTLSYQRKLKKQDSAKWRADISLILSITGISSKQRRMFIGRNEEAKTWCDLSQRVSTVTR